MKTETVFGIHAVQSILKSAPQRVCELIVARDRQDQRVKSLLATAQQHKIKPRLVERKELDALCSGGNHQGVIVLAKPGEKFDELSLLELIDEADSPLFWC
jgi:rRNA methylases